MIQDKTKKLFLFCICGNIPDEFYKNKKCRSEVQNEVDFFAWPFFLKLV